MKRQTLATTTAPIAASGCASQGTLASMKPRPQKQVIDEAEAIVEEPAPHIAGHHRGNGPGDEQKAGKDWPILADLIEDQRHPQAQDKGHRQGVERKAHRTPDAVDKGAAAEELGVVSQADELVASSAEELYLVQAHDQIAEHGVEDDDRQDQHCRQQEIVRRQIFAPRTASNHSTPRLLLRRQSPTPPWGLASRSAPY